MLRICNDNNNILRTFNIYQIFLSPQVKRSPPCLVISRYNGPSYNSVSLPISDNFSAPLKTGARHAVGYLMFSKTFLAIFVVFHRKICVFIIFISCFDKVSANLRNNYKHESVIRNCQQNCIVRVCLYKEVFQRW